MKKLPILLAATSLVASVGAFAQLLPNDAAPFNVNIPNLKSGFGFNIEGSFLKPTNSDLDYGFVRNNVDELNNLLTVKPDTDFAWGAGISYVFPNSGNDVQLNWTGFSHTTTDSSTFFEDDDSSDDLHLITPSGDDINLDNLPGFRDLAQISGQAKAKLSAIDLDAGQYLDIGNRLQLRPFAGVRFARVESTLTGRYVAIDDDVEDPDATLLENDRFHSKFHGVGPRLGLDANYNLGGGFAAVGNVATSLLIGKVDTDTLYNTNFPGSNADDGARLDTKNVTRVVPAVDAKVGLSYNYTFDCDSVVTVEGGYKTTQYIDAVDRLSAQFNGAGNANQITRTTSSLGFSGPYVKLAVKL